MTVTCFAELTDTAVPVHLGDRVIGYLQTGQIASSKPNIRRFEKIAKQVIEWGAQVDLSKLEDAYFHSRVLAPRQYAAMVSRPQNSGYPRPRNNYCVSRGRAASSGIGSRFV